MTYNEIIMSLEIGIIFGIVAMGVYITFRIIDFPDLTCDGSFVLGAVCGGMIIKAGYNPYLALIIALMSGLLAGFITGILNSYLKINTLLSGILVAFMLYSINLRIMGNIPNIALFGFSNIFTENNLLICTSIFLLMFIVAGYLLNSDFGLAIRSIGQNKRLAKNYGVNTAQITIISLMIANSLISLGGGIFSQYQGFVDIGSGTGTIIVSLASVIIGEHIWPAKSIWLKLFSCLIGSIIYRLFISFALHSDYLGINSSDLNLVTGILIIAVMLIPRRKKGC